jgi:hypothetical protein
MKKIIWGLVMMVMGPSWGEAQTDMRALYESILEMQVASMRLSRDKLYEIYHPNFELLQPDMARAISISEDMMARITEAMDGSEWERQFGAVEDVWNHLRLSMMSPLAPEEYTRFHYECVTLNRYLDVLADTLEARLESRYPHLDRVRNRYALRQGVYLVNTGYMTRHHRLAQSMQHILDENLPQVRERLEKLKKNPPLASSSSISLLAAVLNEWNFFHYNLSNPLFSPEKTLFSMANTLNWHIYLLFNRPQKSGKL